MKRFRVLAFLTMAVFMFAVAGKINVEAADAPATKGWHQGLYYVLNGDGDVVKANGVYLTKSRYNYFKDGQVNTGIQGLKLYNKRYYYFNKGVGTCPTESSLKKVDGIFYAFADNGRSLTGVKKINGAYYHFNDKGKGSKGWFSVSGKKYYADQSGRYVKGWYQVGSYYYYFAGKSGIMQKDKLVDHYKLDSKGRSKTRVYIMDTVAKYTKSSMSKKQKIKALWDFMQKKDYTYIRDLRHIAPGWKWPADCYSDYAKGYFKNKGANCFGYASTYAFLVKEATGLRVRIYHGETPAAAGGMTPHGWVCVKLDGEWRVFDTDMYKFHGNLSKWYNVLYEDTRLVRHCKGQYIDL